MADPKDNRKPTKTPLEFILAKILPKSPPPPEPSYFDKPEPDREEERKGAARVRQAAAAQKAAVEAKDKDRLNKAFAPVTLIDQKKLDQRIEAIADEEQRAAAIEAREDAEELKEINQAKINAVLEKDRKFWDRFDTSRPVPEDTAKQQNQDRDQALEQLYRVRIAIQDTMESAIAKAEVASWRITPQITHEQLRLAHQPSESPPAERPTEPPTTLPGWLTDIQRAAAALPPPPKQPGLDVPR